MWAFLQKAILTSSLDLFTGILAIAAKIVDLKFGLKLLQNLQEVGSSIDFIWLVCVVG